MHKEFISDLKIARKRSGLTQADCGHLIGVTHQTISKIENGKRLPAIPDICALSLLYSTSFESLFASVIADAREGLASNVSSIPDVPHDYPRRHVREQTIARLVQRLEDELNPPHGC